ncbi:MAG: hypothetical protein PHW66_09670 [Gallionella sp.]|nr:hypothetical protein [Gallionella sp.]
MTHGQRKYDGLTLEEKVDEALAILATIAYAFPDGPEAHRYAHEAMIKASAAQEQFWNELKLDVAKKGLWGLLVIIVGLVLAGAATKLGVLAALVK